MELCSVKGGSTTDKILDLTKLKLMVDDKINVTKTSISLGEGQKTL